jgi:hypothetical protein
VEIINILLSFFGNVTSIIGFFMTIAVWYGVKSLKAFYVAKATVPRQLQELTNLREEIEELFSGKFDPPNRDKVIELSLSANVSVRNLMSKLKEMDKSQYSIQIEPNAKDFIKDYEMFVRNPTKENARVMNRRLFALLRSAQLVLNDDDWRRTQ